MKIVEYCLADNSHVGRFKCPDCSLEVLAWKSSGMSAQWPHFYCSDCSNVIHRDSDQTLIVANSKEYKLREIAESLPVCACGGRFTPGANPKCPSCKHEFRHQGSPLARLKDPHLILVDGAVKYSDHGPDYQVKITHDKLAK